MLQLVKAKAGLREFVRLFSAKTQRPKKALVGLPQSQLSGKNVLVRVDYNVPLEKGKILEDTRILETLPTIDHLRKAGARVILCSHLGSPKGVVSESLSLAPVAKRLSELLKTQVSLTADCVGEKTKEKASGLKNGEVLLLENLRFHKEEEKNVPAFSQELLQSTLASVYVNDAFGTAHRAHASIVGIPSAIKSLNGPSVAGILMAKELKYARDLFANPKKPVLIILGGAKIDTKLKILENAAAKADVIFLGSRPSLAFWKAAGGAVGKVEISDAVIQNAKNISEYCKKTGKELLFATDMNAGAKPGDPQSKNVGMEQGIPEGSEAYDIGTRTLAQWEAALKTIKPETIIWNGPMGFFEFGDVYQHSTGQIAKWLSDATKRGVTTVLGGGETLASIKLLSEKAGQTWQYTHVSTGGGAFLECLEGKELPGVAILDDA